MYAFVDDVLGIKDGGIKRLYAGIRGALQPNTTDDTIWTLGLIALLATTEHLSILNGRKRLLEKDQGRLLEELRILNILFGSPLQKHTKSPMLWQHRRWLIEQLAAKGLLHSSYPDTFLQEIYAEVWDDAGSKDWVALEMSTVIKAGELHPKNYYAWSYARYLVRWFSPDLLQLAEAVFAVCKRHVSDISSWSFLDHVLQQHGDPVLQRDYAERAFAMTRIVTGHEALWWFLRISIVKSNAEELVHDISDSVAPDASEADLRTRSLVWIKRMATRGTKHRRSSSPVNDRTRPIKY